METPQTVQLPVDDIQIQDDLNGRLQHDHAALTTLARNMQAVGQINPIRVRWDGEKHTLIAGRRRLAAAKLLGWPTITATFQPPNEKREALQRLAENSNRSDLSPVEEAAQIADLVNTHGLAIDAIAERLGRTVDWVAGRLAMADWPDSLLDAIHSREISLSAAHWLAKIQPDDFREYYISQARETGCPARTAAYWYQQVQAQQLPNADPESTAPVAIPPDPGYVTTVNCFACRERKPLADTTQVKICTACIQALNQYADQPPTPPHPDNP